MVVRCRPAGPTRGWRRKFRRAAAGAGAWLESLPYPVDAGVESPVVAAAGESLTIEVAVLGDPARRPDGPAARASQRRRQKILFWKKIA